MENLKLIFLGTGTSQGIPIIACKCPVCLSTDTKDKRLRSSVLIEVNNQVIVIDSGPDFRYQMLRARVEKLDAILFTHEHKDHTAGLDDIRAFNWINKKAIDIYAEERVHNSLKQEFAYVFAEIQYPGIPQLNLCTIENKPFHIKGVEITPIRAKHFKLPVYGYRIGKIAYLTDANYISEEEKQKLKGLKVLVLNALRKEKHLSHFTLSEALLLIKELKPEKAYLTHLSHQLGFHKEVSKELPKNVFMAYDGLEIEI